ncbi:MAG: SpoIIE family protein phosphatase [Eubacterium sp.]|nr:SpoIIE family protein phosphatase [Eubacterium sp.]
MMIAAEAKREPTAMKKGLSISAKTVMMTIGFMAILTVMIALIGYKLYYNSVMDSYSSYAETVLEYAYRAAEEYGFGEMIAERDMPKGYEEFRSELNVIKDSSDIEYLYAIYFEDVDDIHSLHYAINAKNSEELSSGKPLSEIYTYMGKPCEEGGFADDTLLILQQAIQNSKRESGTLEGYSDEYGHMLNGYRVLFDSDGNAAGLLCVEIDINRINVGMHRYIATVILTAVIFMAIIVAAYILNIRRYLTGPIIRIAKSSDNFVKKMQSGVNPEELFFEDADVNTGGELQGLSKNVESLANGVATYMTNLQTAMSEKERIGTELGIASQIQEASIPSLFPAYPNRTEFDIYASMTPAKEVGGDFYDFFLIDDDHLALVMADVSGKGVPAALFMMVTKILINDRTLMGGTPGEILTFVNDRICENNSADMFVTVWMGILEISTGIITAANAGHDDPAVYRADGSFEIVKNRHGPVIGAMEGLKYKNFEIRLGKGDKIFLYTDGVPEATDSQNRMFTTDGMLNALNAGRNCSPQEILNTVWDHVNAFVGDAPQFDDLTMLCLEMKDDLLMKTLTVDAKLENLSHITDFLDAYLEEIDCPMKTQTQLDLCVEEIFVNIASYAYPDEAGTATVDLSLSDGMLTLVFKDSGFPYDPLQKADPDITLSADEREIGGLGVFLVKKTMDDVSYQRENGENILTIRKKIQ